VDFDGDESQCVPLSRNTEAITSLIAGNHSEGLRDHNVARNGRRDGDKNISSYGVISSEAPTHRPIGRCRENVQRLFRKEVEHQVGSKWEAPNSERSEG